MSRMFNIRFGRVRGKETWVWGCDCGCNYVSEQFESRRAAEKDAEKTLIREAEEETRDGVAIH